MKDILSLSSTLHPQGCAFEEPWHCNWMLHSLQVRFHGRTSLCIKRNLSQSHAHTLPLLPASRAGLKGQGNETTVSTLVWVWTSDKSLRWLLPSLCLWRPGVMSVRVQCLGEKINMFPYRTQHTLVMLLEACYLTCLALLICKMGTVSASMSKDG